MEDKATTKTESQGERTLDLLKVIDRIEVGPVRLEPNRIRSPYRVTPFYKT